MGTYTVTLGNIAGLARDVGQSAPYAQANRSQCNRLAYRTQGLVNLLEPLRARVTSTGRPSSSDPPHQALQELERILRDAQDAVRMYTTPRMWARAVFQDGANPQRFEKITRDLEAAAGTLNLGTQFTSLFNRADDTADLTADIASINDRQLEIIRLVMELENPAAPSGTGARQDELQRQLMNTMSTSQGFLAKSKASAQLLNQILPALTEDFIVPWSDIRIVKKLGGGAFGEVHLAKLKNLDDVAVKILKSAATESLQIELGARPGPGGLVGAGKVDQKAVDEFMNELKLMVKLRHKNIVLLMAAVLDTNRKALVMEYMAAGSLYHVIRDRSRVLTWPQKIAIANDIAKGCAYLISMGVLHRDLKSGNVMVGDDYKSAKICDFGLSQSLKQNAKDVVGSIRWIAPELFDLKPNTEKSDVFAFGMILYELSSGRLPFEELRDDSQVEYAYRNGQRPAMPRGVPGGFWSIIERCWHQDPNKRPTFADMITQGWFAPSEPARPTVNPTPTPASAPAPFYPPRNPNPGPNYLDPRRGGGVPLAAAGHSASAPPGPGYGAGAGGYNYGNVGRQPTANYGAQPARPGAPVIPPRFESKALGTAGGTAGTAWRGTRPPGVQPRAGAYNPPPANPYPPGYGYAPR